MLMSAEQLQLVLEANNRSMVALLGRLPTHVAAEPSPSVVPPKIVRIDVPKWKDEDTPFDFFSKFEKAQRHNGVSRDQWGTLLEVYLSGKAQAAYTQVDPEKLEDYEAVKNTMLRSLGILLSRQTGIGGSLVIRLGKPLVLFIYELDPLLLGGFMVW